MSGKFLMVLKGCSRRFQKSIKDVPRVFRESFKGISRKFQGCLKEDGRGLKEYFKEVQSEFQRSYKVFQES